MPLKVFHMFDYPAVSTVQQHGCCSGAHGICLLLQSNSANTKYFIYVTTTTQQHDGYNRQINVCCIEHFYRVRSEMNMM